jgi:ubiquinone/menaquinone biosynthesis C-methylase UbiE
MSPVDTALGLAARAAKTAVYAGHYLWARRVSGPYARPGSAPFASPHPPPALGAVAAAFMDVLAQDQRNVDAGLYPAPDWMRELSLLRVSPDYRRDVLEIDRRRMAGSATEVREDPASDGWPAYYRQNFHWQSGGWFSEDSARLYDFQVETLFTGSAAAMRRATALALLADSLKGQDQRRILTLDLACGTGSFTREIARAFPRMALLGADLSPAYTAHAAAGARTGRLAGFVTADATHLPLPDASLDRVVSVYLFHELPPKVRAEVMGEVARVLKPGGVFVLADSLRTGDDPRLDRLLDAFPFGFHEPFFASWLACGIDGLATGAGLQPGGSRQAFLTRAMAFTRPA